MKVGFLGGKLMVSFINTLKYEKKGINNDPNWDTRGLSRFSI